MNLRTKVITTIIAMVCSLSVSATGIAAIIMEFPISVANSTIISMGEVQGDLYIMRRGTNAPNFNACVYENGVGIHEAELNYITQNVSFGTNSKEMTYTFYFCLSESAENGAKITLTDAVLTNTSTYTATYSYSYETEPKDWSTASAVTLNKPIMVDKTNDRVWLRAKLVVNNSAYSRIDTNAIWSFNFNFEGVATSVS